MEKSWTMNSIELFAGGGGLALATAKSGFNHSFLVEWDSDSAATLKHKVKMINIRNIP